MGRCSAVTHTRPEMSSVDQAKGLHLRAPKDEVANTGGPPRTGRKGPGGIHNSGGTKQAGGRGEQHCRGPTIGVSPTWGPTEEKGSHRRSRPWFSQVKSTWPSQQWQHRLNGRVWLLYKCLNYHLRRQVNQNGVACTPMLPGTLTTAKRQKRPTCPSTDKQ